VIKTSGYGGYWTGGFMSKRIFMGPNDGGGGGGTGGDNGGSGEKPEYLTVAQFNEMFHKASTEREKRFEQKLMGNLKTTMETTIGTKFDEIRQLIVEAPEDREDKSDHGGGSGKMSPEIEAILRQTRAEAAEAKKMAEKWQNEATAEKQRMAKNEERQTIQGLLNGQVKPAMLEMLVDQMHSKHLTRDPESQTMLWKDSDGATLPLKEGIAAWLKSDIGKEFAPPRQAQGTGSRGNNGADQSTLRSGTMDMEKLGSIVLGSIPGQR